jgi:hypothetical protein
MKFEIFILNGYVHKHLYQFTTGEPCFVTNKINFFVYNTDPTYFSNNLIWFGKKRFILLNLSVLSTNKRKKEHTIRSGCPRK